MVMEFRRFIAFVIDAFMAVMLLIPICVCIVLLDKGSGISMVVYSVWGVLFCKDCFGGRSFGKRIMGYQVIDRKSRKIANPLKCVLRNLFYILGLIDIVFMFSKSKGRRLGDFATDTEVVAYDGMSRNSSLIEAVITVMCVFLFLWVLNKLMTHYASSLGLWGLMYQ